jgi:hypothetical protein
MTLPESVECRYEAEGTMSRHLTFEHHADLAGWTAEHAGQSNIDMQWSGAIRAICFIGSCFASWGGVIAALYAIF